MRGCWQYQGFGVALCTFLIAACSTTIAGKQEQAPDARPQGAFADAVPAPDAEPPLACDGGDFRREAANGDCYMLFQAPLSWQASQTQCLSLGANLTSIRDAAEQTLVGELAANFPSATPDLWLGATDEQVENTFAWVDGSPFAFEQWRAGEPNNSGPGGSSENCLVIEGDNPAREWDDRFCQSPQPYICKRSAL